MQPNIPGGRPMIEEVALSPEELIIFFNSAIIFFHLPSIPSPFFFKPRPFGGQIKGTELSGDVLDAD
jgi:hypothetical protein